MWFNPFLAQRSAEERIKGVSRETGQERLARCAAVAHRRSPVLSAVEGSIVSRVLLVLGLVSAVVVIWRLV